MISTTTALGLIFLLVILSALLSASETVITGASRAHIHRHAETGGKREQLALWLINQRPRLISAILVGNNLVNILASALAASLFLRFFGEAGILYATLVMTALIVIFAEILPKTWAIMRASQILMRWARFLRWLLFILGPVARMAQFIAGLFLWRRSEEEESDRVAREELLGLIALHRASGKKAEDEAVMLDAILDLAALETEDVMVHRTRIKSVSADLPPTEAVAEILECGHAHVPLWRDKPDNLVGLINVKELSRVLLRTSGQVAGLDLGSLARPLWFVPAARPLRRQLSAFLSRGQRCAMVVDEYGGLAGMITLNDILEEIVGDMGEAADREGEEALTKQEDGSVLAEAQMAVRDCNRILGWSLPEEEAATLAGLVLEEARRLPQEGEQFLIGGVRFEIIARDRRRVRKLKLTPDATAD